MGIPPLRGVQRFKPCGGVLHSGHDTTSSVLSDWSMYALAASSQTLPSQSLILSIEDTSKNPVRVVLHPGKRFQHKSKHKEIQHIRQFSEVCSRCCVCLPQHDLGGGYPHNVTMVGLVRWRHNVWCWTYLDMMFAGHTQRPFSRETFTYAHIFSMSDFTSVISSVAAGRETSSF